MATPRAVLFGADGCYVHPHCLTCPRAVCIYEEEEGERGRESRAYESRVAARNTSIVAYVQAGNSIEETAFTFRVGRRTIHRVLATRATS